MKKQEFKEREPKGEGEISLSASPFLRWLDNFWYHYKWHTLGVLFALIVVTVCTLQTCSKEKHDLTLVYAGPVSLTDADLTGADQLLDRLAPGDFDGDGEKNVTLARYNIYSTEQILALEEEGYAMNRQFNSSEYDNYGNYLLTGESSVYLLDPWLYENLKSADRLRSVEEVCGKVPDAMLTDGYGIRLGDTALYREYDVMKVFPEDTVICLLRQQVMGKSHDDEHYGNEEAMFRALAEAASLQ